jgi:glycosyltransferase involved in cell wall biosynthesis
MRTFHIPSCETWQMTRGLDFMPKTHRLGFGGIICFGGVDWWYHNRGHYDLQMMREFSAELPILYVNSIGMRPPRVSEGAMFATRIKRKLMSLCRGLVKVRDNFYVFSPVTLPGGGRSSVARSLVRSGLRAQVRWAARRAGISNPAVWVACPPAADVVPALQPARIVYQRTDRFEAYAGVDPDRIRSFDLRLKAMSDIVLYSSRALLDAERGECRKALFVDHGVDFDRFRQAGEDACAGGVEPADIATIPRPRAGFVGGIDQHNFDPPLFLEVAARMADVQFVMVGASSLADGWCRLPNVHFLGQRPYDLVPGYMAACDVLIMPWNRSDWIRSCNPVKLKEYLATGRPVVTTWFAEIDNYRDVVSVATEPAAFGEAIVRAIAEPGNAGARRRRVQDHTWAVKAHAVAVGLHQASPE